MLALVFCILWSRYTQRQTKLHGRFLFVCILQSICTDRLTFMVCFSLLYPVVSHLWSWIILHPPPPPPPPPPSAVSYGLFGWAVFCLISSMLRCVHGQRSGHARSHFTSAATVQFQLVNVEEEKRRRNSQPIPCLTVWCFGCLVVLRVHVASQQRAQCIRGTELLRQFDVLSL